MVGKRAWRVGDEFASVEHLGQHFLAEALFICELLSLAPCFLHLLVHSRELSAHTGYTVFRDFYTNLLAVLFGFESHDLQDAGVGDVRDDVRHSFPDAQQSSTQHVILAETHSQKTLLTLLDLLTLTLPVGVATVSEGEVKLAFPDIFCILRQHLVVSEEEVVQVLRMSLFADVGFVEDQVPTTTLFSKQDARLTPTQLV